MNADALLANILANPDDDTPRLIYADWLEEHGDIDRATFIRAQLRQALLDGPANLNPSTTERNALYSQARELLRRNKDTWLAGLPRSLRGRAVEFHRGFVEELNLTVKQVLKVSAKVWASHPIRRLTLNEVSGNLGQLLALPLLSRVRRLLLHAGCLTETDLAALAAATSLAELRDLALLSYTGNSLAAALVRCPSLGGLTHLRLDEQYLADEGLAVLAESANVRNLQMWNLHAPLIGAGGARSLARASGLAALKYLFLGGQIGDEGLAALAGSPHLAGLRLLHLHNHGIGLEGVRALAATKHLTHLQILNLGTNPIGAAGARALAEGSWGKLARLDLGGCPLGDEGAAAVAECRSWPALISLSLDANKITAEGARAIARSPRLANLVWLSLYGNKIGDDGALALCASQTLGKLQTLVLNYCGPFAPTVEAALRKRFGKALYL